MASDLGAVIDAVTAPRPQSKVILVGHSAGAAIVQAYSAQGRSSRIAGMVFVDGACTDVASLRSHGYRLALQAYAIATQALAHIGATRWMVGKLVDPILPAAYAAEAKHYELTIAATQNQARETRGWVKALSAPYIRRPLPDVPVIVLSGNRISRVLSKTHRAILTSHRKLASQAPPGPTHRHRCRPQHSAGPPSCRHNRNRRRYRHRDATKMNKPRLPTLTRFGRVCGGLSKSAAQAQSW